LKFGKSRNVQRRESVKQIVHSSADVGCGTTLLSGLMGRET